MSERIVDFGDKPAVGMAMAKQHGAVVYGEIVRCRDCVCFEDCGKFGQWCTQLDFGKKEIANGYCAWGKRKEGGDD